MRLSDILTVDRIATDLDVRDKAETLRVLARLFVGTSSTLDETSVFRTFAEREELASTGVGSGIAIPHGRMNEVENVEAAMAICPKGIAFDSVDGQPARIFVAVLAPERQTGHQLKVLARISRVLRDAAVRERLLEAHDREAALAILCEEEERRP